MGELDFLEYRVLITRDSDTGQLVAEVPTLGLADYGTDLPDALKHLEDMLRFHLECLHEEGKVIPREQRTDEGFYFRLRMPADAA